MYDSHFKFINVLKDTYKQHEATFLIICNKISDVKLIVLFGAHLKNA